MKFDKKSNDLVCEGGISFFALNAFVEAFHHKQTLEADVGDEAVSEGALDLVDDFDVFDCDGPAKATPAPAKVEAPVVKAAEVATPVEESKEPISVTETAVLAEEKQDETQQRGRGDYRGRRGDGRGRGGYGGRGGNVRAPREDEDGFITETGDKPKPRRGNGGRGRGEYRGDRRGGRGEFRGERGGERGERGDRRGGNRPKTEGTTQPAEQQQQSQQ